MDSETLIEKLYALYSEANARAGSSKSGPWQFSRTIDQAIQDYANLEGLYTPVEGSATFEEYYLGIGRKIMGTVDDINRETDDIIKGLGAGTFSTGVYLIVKKSLQQGYDLETSLSRIEEAGRIAHDSMRSSSNLKKSQYTFLRFSYMVQELL